MTALHFDLVATAIAALEIDGVKEIADLDTMMEKVDARKFPLLGPSSHEPSFITDWTSERMTTGGNYAVEYTLNYVLFFAEFGAERSLFKKFPDLVAVTQAVIDTFLSFNVLNGCKNIKLDALPTFGPVHDASATAYHGATFALRVTEF